MLYTDIPTEEELLALDAVRGDACVSIYLPTTPVTSESGGDRIAFRNLVDEAIGQMEEADRDKRLVAAVHEELATLFDDDDFWAHTAEGLAVFATDDDLRTIRLPADVEQMVMVADRFHLKPLLPLLDAPETGYVLALSQDGVRLVEVSAGRAAELHLSRDLTRGMSGPLGIGARQDHRPSGRSKVGEGSKQLIRQYFRAVNRAVRPLLAGQERPLILAAVDYEAAMYRAESSYPFLAEQHISGNPDAASAEALAERARPILREIRSAKIAAQREAYHARVATGLADDDVATAVRAAVTGRVERLFVDIDRTVDGTVAEDGTVTIAEEPDAGSHGLIDEAAAATLRHHGDVLAVTADEMPTGSPVAAIFRWKEDL